MAEPELSCELMKNPFTSKRLQPVPEPDPVPPHLTQMGWSDATENGALPLDPADAERSARRAGASALAQLHEQGIERQREQREAALAGVRRGIKHGERPSR